MNERQIFEMALNIPDSAERVSYLDRVCGNDMTRRRELQELFDVQQRLGSFLEEPAMPLDATVHYPIAEPMGKNIGPYRLVGELGQGGMGIVYLARQESPVERLVALKIISPGMDSRQVIARFESERQALARMDHPNIARVLDAGTTDEGRPFFVMELVEGMPITTYCDARQLPVRRRLELFVDLCRAIQHAHQKGIIHRDIKPSNVLVAESDGHPRVKVIDFGLAKAIQQPWPERTQFTQIGQVVGTLEYMSPEQATLDALDIDTRSDVYSLGVLLYELMVGETPLVCQRMHGLALEDMLRIVREQEPPKPSARVRCCPTETAANRRATAGQLHLAVRGDLDWIVLKALEKERARRYESPGALAADVQRHMRDEAILACPPARIYQLRKFLRRNQGMVAMAALLLLMLLSGLGVAVWQAVRATRAERLANDLLGEANLARREAERMLRQVRTSRAHALSANATLMAERNSYAAAKNQFREALAIDQDNPLVANNFAWFLATCPDENQRDTATALALARQAVQIHPRSSVFWNTLGVAQYRAGHWRDSIASLERSVQLAGDAHDAFNHFFLAMARWKIGAHDQARRHLEQAEHWMFHRRPRDEELARFRTEAVALLDAATTSSAERPALLTGGNG